MYADANAYAKPGKAYSGTIALRERCSGELEIREDCYMQKYPSWETPGVNHSVPTAFMMNAEGRKWLTPDVIKDEKYLAW